MAVEGSSNSVSDGSAAGGARGRLRRSVRWLIPLLLVAAVLAWVYALGELGRGNDEPLPHTPAPQALGIDDPLFENPESPAEPIGVEPGDPAVPGDPGEDASQPAP
jgi:hypothetical protein